MNFQRQSKTAFLTTFVERLEIDMGWPEAFAIVGVACAFAYWMTH